MSSLSNSTSGVVKSPQSTPPPPIRIPTSCSPKIVKRMQQESCYTCQQRGHWSRYCPSKSPKTKPISPSPSQDSTVSHKRAHGSCGYGVTEDELLNSNSKSIVPIKQRRQRTLHDFWDGSQVQIKRMRITTDCSSENPNTENAANSKRDNDGFPELEFDDAEFINSVSWETVEEEAFLSLSRSSTPSRIRSRQIMFQSRIFSDDDSFEIDKSMENLPTMEEEHNKLFEEEKTRSSQLQENYVKTEALLEAANRHRKLLCEEVSNLKTMLHEKQKQLESCELKTLKIETRLGDLKRRILKTDIASKERVGQTEVASKLNSELKN